MRVILKERPKHVRVDGRIAEQDSKTFIEAEIDCKSNNYLGFDIIRWRDMDFVYNNEIIHGKAVYVRATGTTVNWEPNPDGEPFTG
jgi:hypothetical protein